MARTTRTATAPAPAPGDKPARQRRNGKVRTLKVDPAALAQTSAADLSAAGLPDNLAAMLAAAQVEAAAKREKAKKAAEPRVAVTAEEAAALAAAGWKAPKVSAAVTAKPKARQRQNACRGDAAYTVAAQILTTGQTLTVPALAALWIAAGNAPRPIAGVLQQISNRTQRTITQTGATIAAG